MDLTVHGRALRILDRIAIGSIATLYRCRIGDGSDQVEGVLKIARDARTNDLLGNEAAILRQLHSAVKADRFAAFLPNVLESFAFGNGTSSAPRWANVLRMHPALRSPDELYTLTEVRTHYQNGLDPRDVAWIWRRLLNVLGFIHAHDVVHAAVLPVHVLIEPLEHKLLLVDFCAAVAGASQKRRPPVMINGGYDAWYTREQATGVPPASGLDISFGARCMIELLGGDPLSGAMPSTLDPALTRHFERCIHIDPAAKADAWKLLDDFDQLIETLWGPRKFRVLAMPPKQPLLGR